MLALKTDYLTIDVEKVDYTSGGTSEDPEIKVEIKTHYSELLRNVTIQCNGKLRRTWFTTRVVKDEETNEYDLESYDTAYNPLRIISDLGYEVPTDMGCHKMITEAIEKFYPHN